MEKSPQLYAFLLGFSAFLTAFAFGIAQARRNQTGATFLLIFLSGTIVWSLTYALHWLSLTPEAKNFWLDATYLGVVITPPGMFLYIFSTTRPNYRLRPVVALLFFVIPALTLAMLASDDRLGLFYGGKVVGDQSRIFDGGPGFWLSTIYGYSLTVITFGLLIWALRRQDLGRRDQARILLVGLLAPVAANLVMFVAGSLLAWDPFVGLDITPIAFTATGLIFTYGLLNQRLLGLMTLGRDVVVEHMRDGMLLLDDRLCLVDVNPAARRLLNLPAGNLTGRPAGELLPPNPEIQRLLGGAAPSNGVEIALENTAQNGDDLQETPPQRHLLFQATHLPGRQGRPAGVVLTCRDHTDRKNFEVFLQQQIEQIQSLQADLREQATHDALTGLFNRRYLSETLPRELARAERDGLTLCLALLDLDYFKQLNDVHGHQAGDEVLQYVARMLTENTRRSDVVARFGGEEFLVAMLDAPPEIARQRADQWRVLFETSGLVYQNSPLETTLSAGVSVYPTDGDNLDELLRKADIALYQAKADGRNRVQVYHPDLDRSRSLHGNHRKL